MTGVDGFKCPNFFTWTGQLNHFLVRLEPEPVEPLEVGKKWVLMASTRQNG
jgi:hypothetical protein